MRHLSDAQAALILKKTFPDRPFSLGCFLGAGGQGSVWELHRVGQPAVCKMVSTEPSESLELTADAANRYREFMTRNCERELESLKQFSSSRYFPTLIDYRVYITDNGARVYVFVEEQLIPLLPTAFTELQLSPRELTIRVGLEVSHALSELSLYRRVHRDLKVPNMFLRINNDGGSDIVLSDFGSSKQFTPEESQIVVRTPGHIAPERRHRAASISNREDVYLLGITLLEIYFQKDLYISDEEELAHEVTGRLNLLKMQDPALYEPIRKMLCQNPLFRPSPSWCIKEFEKLSPTSNPLQCQSDARRAMFAFQIGSFDEVKRLTARLPVTDARRYLLLALISDSHSERVFNLRLAARLGSPAACYYVGEALLSGENGMERDPNLGIEYLRCAAKANYAPAVYRLHCLQTGARPLPQDTPKNRIAFLMEEIAS